MKTSVIIAPIYTGKTALMAGAPWRHTSRGRRVMDADVLVQPIHTLYRVYGVPDATWTSTQWASWNAARGERLMAAILAKRDPSLIVLVHSASDVPSAVVLAAVLIPEDEFRRRAHAFASKRDLALRNRKGLADYLRVSPDVPVFRDLSHAMEAF